MTTRRLAAGALLGVALLGVAAVSAQSTAAPPAPGPPLPRLTRLADGVFFYEHVDPTKAGVSVNNLVVIGTQAVLVADGQGTPENTAQLVAAVATLTPLPIRYLVIGSEHGDHRGGDAAFPATAVVVKHSPANDARTVDLGGGHEAVVRFLGRAHTGTDLEVFVPRARVVYMSEAFISGIFPSLANGFPSEWVATLRRAEALAADVFLPAHGLVSMPPATSREALAAYRGALERVLAEGQRLHDAGVPVADAAAKAQFGGLAGWHRYAENVAGALKRVYQELDGALPPAPR